MDRWWNFTWPLMMDSCRCALIASQDAVVHAHFTYGKRVAQKQQMAGRMFREGPRAFELYGIDFSLDYEMRPWLLEANVSPDLLGNSGPQLRLQGRDALDELLSIVVKEPRSVPGYMNMPSGCAPNVTRLDCCDSESCYSYHGVHQVPPSLICGHPIDLSDRRTDWYLFLKAPRQDAEVLTEQFSKRKSEEWSERSTKNISGHVVILNRSRR